MACHELNFFLYHKDRKFFESVVKPLIKQKLQKQLVDLWLLGESLEEYDELWRVQRLNTLERILLARSVGSRLQGTSRWLIDNTKANPVDPEWRARRFEVALRGMALDADASRALEQVLAEDYALRFDGADKANLAPGAMQMGGMGAGGMGGGGMRGGGMRGVEGKAGAGYGMGMGGEGAETWANNAPAESARFFGDDAKRKQQMRGAKAGKELGLELLREERESLFRSLDQTREWAETHYYRIQLRNQIADLIPPSLFWREYIERQNDAAFLPSNLDLPTKQINEALCAIGCYRSPFDGLAPEISIENEQLVLKTKQPSILFVESIEKAIDVEADDAGGDGVLVGQMFTWHSRTPVKIPAVPCKDRCSAVCLIAQMSW